MSRQSFPVTPWGGVEAIQSLSTTKMTDTTEILPQKNHDLLRLFDTRYITKEVTASCQQTLSNYNHINNNSIPHHPRDNCAIGLHDIQPSGHFFFQQHDLLTQQSLIGGSESSIPHAEEEEEDESPAQVLSDILEHEIGSLLDSSFNTGKEEERNSEISNMRLQPPFIQNKNPNEDLFPFEYPVVTSPRLLRNDEAVDPPPSSAQTGDLCTRSAGVYPHREGVVYDQFTPFSSPPILHTERPLENLVMSLEIQNLRPESNNEEYCNIVTSPREEVLESKNTFRCSDCMKVRWISSRNTGENRRCIEKKGQTCADSSACVVCGVHGWVHTLVDENRDELAKLINPCYMEEKKLMSPPPVHFSPASPNKKVRKTIFSTKKVKDRMKGYFKDPGPSLYMDAQDQEDEDPIDKLRAMSDPEGEDGHITQEKGDELIDQVQNVRPHTLSIHNIRRNLEDNLCAASFVDIVDIRSKRTDNTDILIQGTWEVRENAESSKIKILAPCSSPLIYHAESESKINWWKNIYTVKDPVAFGVSKASISASCAKHIATIKTIHDYLIKNDQDYMQNSRRAFHVAGRSTTQIPGVEINSTETYFYFPKLNDTLCTNSKKQDDFNTMDFS